MNLFLLQELKMKQYLNFNYNKINNYSLSSHFSTIFKQIELIFFIVLSIIFLVTSKINRDFTNNISYFFVDLSLPVVKVAAFPFNLLISLTTNFEELVDAKKDNQALKEENEKMRSLLVNSVNVENENKELKEILSFVAAKSTSYQMAKVRGKTHGIFNQQLFLETREGSEIKDGSAVISGIGMIGRAVDSLQNKARLLLLTDANSHIPIIVSKARARGILTGNGSNSMEINFLPKGHNIEVGDLVFTSSDGDKLPPGLLVGVIKEVSGSTVSVEMAQDAVNADVVTILDY